MSRKVVFRSAARNDLKSLYNYIARTSGQQAAGAYINRIEAACRMLAEFPERGTVRNHISAGLRIIGFERRAAIAFKVDGDTVRILRILYGGKAFPRNWQAD